MAPKTTQKNQSLVSMKIHGAALADAVRGDADMGDATVSSMSSAFKTTAYHELLENPHVELDGLQRLQENLAQLEDLHGRLRFMMRDLTGLIRRR